MLRVRIVLVLVNSVIDCPDGQTDRWTSRQTSCNAMVRAMHSIVR